MRPLNKSGGRQPAVVWESRLRRRFGTQSRDTSRATKSGGRQPAVVLRYERFAARITHCSPTALPLNKSGARQPAVACNANAVLRESRTVGRPRDPGTEAARINPPWLPESRRQRRPVFAGELHLHRTSGSGTTAGLHQPLLMHDVGALKKRHSRCTIACSQERRASTHRALL
jgi:hypothetical protein